MLALVNRFLESFSYFFMKFGQCTEQAEAATRPDRFIDPELPRAVAFLSPSFSLSFSHHQQPAGLHPGTCTTNISPRRELGCLRATSRKRHAETRSPSHQPRFRTPSRPREIHICLSSRLSMTTHRSQELRALRIVRTMKTEPSNTKVLLNKLSL